MDGAINRLGRRRCSGLLLAAALAGGGASLPMFAVATPQQPVVRLFVPYGAGGEADTSARNFVTSATRADASRGFELVHLGADFGGAAGRAVMEAAPDGQTLLLARVGNLAVMPAVAPRTAPSWSSFTVLALLDQAPLICAVRSASPIKSLRDLQAAMKASPGRLRYSTGGANTVQSMAVRYLLALSGLPADAARPVHFSQGSQATQAVTNGEADFVCNTPRSMLPLVESGQLQPLFTTAQGRLKALPWLQNAAELGLRDMQHLQAWSALVGPPRMPPAAVERWRTVLGQVADDAEWQAATEVIGASPRIRAVPDAAAFLRQQAQFYERLVTLLGARQ